MAASEPFPEPSPVHAKGYWCGISTLDGDQREANQTFYHPTSTCSIGKVVDSRLNVQGTEGLRVVDASVMPTIVRGNTNAATIAIAERASDLIAGPPMR